MTDIATLIHELAPGSPIPTDEDRAWHLLRGLLNAREPGPLSESFYAAQDRLLSSLIAARGIVAFEATEEVEPGIRLWVGDITRLQVDAIVNAANSALLGCFSPNHMCIDNAIHTFAGAQLREECAAIMAAQGHPEPTGQAKITGAYNLPSKHVLHTVGPIVTDALTDEHRHLLANCYVSCLDLAREHGLRHVAFCAISTGVFRFPADEAARIAVETVRRYRAEHEAAPAAVFNVFTSDARCHYEQALA